MEISHLQLILTISCLCLLWISGLASVPSRYSLGIDPRDESYFKSNVIKCKDGSKKFTREQLNDEFCDCADGTDEPGTSACPEGNFYCQNAGHVPLTIFSSRVNDGICDCCDGSDEYDGTVNCPNSCWEAGNVAKEKLIKKIKTYQGGVTVRKKEVETAKQAFTKDQEDLSKLKSEENTLKDLVDKLKDHKERIEKEEKRLKEAAEEECLKKEKEERRLKEEEEKAKDQENMSDKVPSDTANEVHEGSTKQDLPKVSPVEAKKDHHVETGLSSDLAVEQEREGPDDISSLSKEEVGRLVASRWTGDNAAHKVDGVGRNMKDDVHEDIPDSGEEDDTGYTSETDDDIQKYDDDDFEDDVDGEHADDHVESDELYKPNDAANNDFPEADRVRKEYEDSKSKLSNIQSRISRLNEKLKHDFGRESEFYSFYNRCFENKQSKYVYKVCPFKQASQVEGHRTTRLGKWEKFDKSYRAMRFSNGDGCWNGPDRSLKVRLRCGLTDELTDIDEPSRCEYVALLSTPALCREDKLKELQHKLEQMNTGQPQRKDEL